MSMFVNKYPINNAFFGDDGAGKELPALTPMKIESVGGDYIQLKPLNKIDDCHVSVSSGVFSVCFHEIEHLPT